MNSENKSETPHTNSIRLIIAAGDWRNESDCTKCALDELENMERALNKVKNSPHQLELARQILANDQLQSEFNRLRADLKNAQDAIASARDAALVEAAEIACKRSTGRSGPTSRPMLVAREIYHAILALRTQPAKERTEK